MRSGLDRHFVTNAERLTVSFAAILPVFFIYGGLTYLVLWLFSLAKSSTETQQELPPPPLFK